MTGRAAANSAIVGDDDDDDDDGDVFDVAKATVSNHIASRDIDIAK